MSFPLVSIITAVKNNPEFIEQAIQSVLTQTYRNVQYIVIDGASTDTTVQIIEKYSGKIDAFISEPDSGIAEAWNKGLKYVKGEIVGLLNADDFYHSESVAKVVEKLDPCEKVLTYGNTIWVDRKTGEHIKARDPVFRSTDLWKGFNFFHTTCFVPKRMYDLVGGFSLRYKIAVDTDFLLRCLTVGARFENAGNTTFMRTGGLSMKRELFAYSEYVRQLFLYPVPWKIRIKAVMRLCKAKVLRFV